MDKYLKAAIEEYETKIESGEPFYMDAGTLMDIEEQYEREQRQYDAERILRFAEKLHPDSEDVQIVRAYREKSKSHWTKALKIIKSIGNQQNRDVQLFYAEWEAAGGQPEKAEKRVNDCLPAHMEDEDYDWLLDLGEIYLDYGYIDRAIKVLKQIPKNYKLKDRVNELLADAHFQVHNYDESISASSQLVDSNPYDAISWTQLADIQQKCLKYQDCITSCDYALAIDPKCQRAMNLKVFATFALGNIDEGSELCREYMKLSPDDYSLPMYIGEQLYTAGNYDKSKIYLQDALRLCPIENPDHTRIVNDLAYTYIGMGSYTKAEELMISLCMLGNSPTDALLQLATIYSEFQLTDQSIQAIRKALSFPTAEMKDYMSAAQQLYTANCFGRAQDIWTKMAQLPLDKEYVNLAIFSAFAMQKIGNHELLKRNFRFAMEHCFELTVQALSSIMRPAEIEQLMREINDEQGYI